MNISVTDKMKIDKRKQKLALMPNLVHSLDAASMALLYVAFNRQVRSEAVNFYGVHDCFAVTSPNVSTLIHTLKGVYTSIYSDIKYIKKFDENIIKFINSQFGDEFSIDDSTDPKNGRIITIANKKYKLPNIPSSQSVLDLSQSSNIII